MFIDAYHSDFFSIAFSNLGFLLEQSRRKEQRQQDDSYWADSTDRY